MHLVLTGAAGSVGKHALRHILACGHSVTALDIAPLPEPFLAALDDEAKARVAFYTVDLCDFGQLEAVLDRIPPVDGMIHNGGIPTPLITDARTTFNVNTSSTYNVLWTCAKYGIHRVVLASSVNAYGLSFTPPGHKFFDELPLSETSPPTPEDPYATSKISCELQATAVCRYFPGMRVASLRYHMCRENYKLASADSRHPSLWGWVSLEACADACLRGITSEGWTGHEVFNLASEEICWEGGLGAESRFNGERPDSLALLEAHWAGRYDKLDRAWWDGRPRRGFFDCRKAGRLLGWQHADDV